MIIISSQRHLNDDIVEQKVEELKGEESVTLPIIYAGECNGDQLYILIDGHHTYAAAKESDIKVRFEEFSKSERGYNNEWTLDETLENLWMDSDYYNIETGCDYF